MAGHPYDAVLFDLDGTLVAPEFEHVRGVFDRVGEHLGTHFSDETARRLWHGLGGPRNDHLRDLGVDPGAFWRVFDATEQPERRAAAMEVFEDAALAARLPVPTGLVTHCPPDPTAAVLEYHGLDAWFDSVVCCSDDLGWKPDPGPLQHALADLGLPAGTRTATDGGIGPAPNPGGAGASTVDAGPTDGGAADATDAGPVTSDDAPRALYVGDTPGDVGAAWNAGLDAVHVERFGHELREHCVLADYRVERLDECEPLAAMAAD